VGTDGHDLSDYDLVGSRKLEAGLFALSGVERLDILYLPPPGKWRDVGPTALLAAERFCRERGAMLLLDPLLDWQTPQDAIAGVRAPGYASSNLISYFPRMLDRRDAARRGRAVGGALAGLLCKLDRKHGAWQELNQTGLGFSRDLQPAVDVDADDETALIRAGLNVVAKQSAGTAHLRG
jgi:hypothetical protein